MDNLPLCDEDWMEAVDELLQNSQEEELEIEAATNGVTSVADADEASTESSSLPSYDMKTTSWWAQLLKRHTHGRHPPQEQGTPITLVSGCSGVCAESEVLKEPQLIMECFKKNS